MSGRLTGPATPPITSTLVGRENSRARLRTAWGCDINFYRLTVTRHLVITISGRHRNHPGVLSRVANLAFGRFAAVVPATIVPATIVPATIVPATIIAAAVLGTGGPSVASGGYHDHACLIEASNCLLQERVGLRESQAH